MLVEDVKREVESVDGWISRKELKKAVRQRLENYGIVYDKFLFSAIVRHLVHKNKIQYRRRMLKREYASLGR